MTKPLPANPFGGFILSFALFVGGLSRCVVDFGPRSGASSLLFSAVLDRLDKLFCRVHRAVLLYEPGRPNRRPSAACMEAAAIARAERTARGETAQRTTRSLGFRLPGGFGWLPRFLPEAEAYSSRLRDVLNDPALAELVANVPSVRRTLVSLCNMLGVGNFMVQPANEAVLGQYHIGRGWRARAEPASPDTRHAASPAPAPARLSALAPAVASVPASGPGRRQDE